MKINIILLGFFFSIFSILTIFSEDLNNNDSDDNKIRVYINYYFDNKTIFNNEFFILDMDNQENKDASNDMSSNLKMNKNLRIEKDINKINYYKNLFKKSFIYLQKQIYQFLKNKKNNLELYLFDKNLLSDIRVIDYLIDIYIEKYNEGEFNLIKNKNCEISYFVKLSKNNNKIYEFKKKYIVKTNSDYPLEIIRLERINDQLINDILKFNIFKNNSDLINEKIKDKDKDKKTNKKKNAEINTVDENDIEDSTSDKNLRKSQNTKRKNIKIKNTKVNKKNNTDQKEVETKKD